MHSLRLAKQTSCTLHMADHPFSCRPHHPCHTGQLHCTTMAGPYAWLPDGQLTFLGPEAPAYPMTYEVRWAWTCIQIYFLAIIRNATKPDEAIRIHDGVNCIDSEAVHSLPNDPNVSGSQSLPGGGPTKQTCWTQEFEPQNKSTRNQGDTSLREHGQGQKAVVNCIGHEHHGARPVDSKCP